MRGRRWEYFRFREWTLRAELLLPIWNISSKWELFHLRSSSCTLSNTSVAWYEARVSEKWALSFIPGIEACFWVYSLNKWHTRCLFTSSSSSSVSRIMSLLNNYFNAFLSSPLVSNVPHILHASDDLIVRFSDSFPLPRAGSIFCLSDRLNPRREDGDGERPELSVSPTYRNGCSTSVVVLSLE